jgi:hypothetical protein
MIHKDYVVHVVGGLIRRRKKYVDLTFRSRILRFNYILGADQGGITF